MLSKVRLLHPIRLINHIEASRSFNNENSDGDSPQKFSNTGNPNSVIIRGDIFNINREQENDNIRLTLKVRRESVTRFGEPYIRSEYFNVNFYGTSDPMKKWKMPRYYRIGDNVTTYSNLCQVNYSDIKYLKGYAMKRHTTPMPEVFDEQNLSSEDTVNDDGELSDDEEDGEPVDEIEMTHSQHSTEY